MEVAMKVRPLMIIVALIVLGAGSAALAMLNNACKSSYHAWCAQDVRHHIAASRD
jgi:hypothetical protein